jgi:hypothetical protein
MSKLHRSLWLSELKIAFPNLRNALNAEEGLLSFEMGVFAKFTQQKIAANDRETVRKCFDIALKYYVGGNARLRDAIDTCYVEDLNFHQGERNSRDWAWDLFPTPLKTLHEAFRGR